MKQCKECGTLSSDDTVFCYICGTKFTDNQSEKIIGSGETTSNLTSMDQMRLPNHVLAVNAAAESLNMNGVYYFMEGGFRYLLKFSPNGDVQGTSDTNAMIPSPTEIRSITYRDHGRYSVNNLQLIFSLSNQQGQVDYWGQISDGKLILNLHSHINGHQATNQEYKFVEI